MRRLSRRHGCLRPLPSSAFYQVEDLAFSSLQHSLLFAYTVVSPDRKFVLCARRIAEGFNAAIRDLSWALGRHLDGTMTSSADPSTDPHPFHSS